MKQWRLFAGLEVLRNWPLANLQSEGLLKKASVMTFVPDESFIFVRNGRRDVSHFST
jgi:hypothetical protein